MRVDKWGGKLFKDGWYKDSNGRWWPYLAYTLSYVLFWWWGVRGTWGLGTFLFCFHVFFRFPVKHEAWIWEKPPQEARLWGIPAVLELQGADAAAAWRQGLAGDHKAGLGQPPISGFQLLHIYIWAILRNGCKEKIRR